LYAGAVGCKRTAALRSGYQHLLGTQRGLRRGKTAWQKLLHRIERSRRYAVDPSGVRTLCSYLLLREQVIKPLLAGIVRPRGRPPKVRNPLDQHYVALRQELNRTFETIGLAAA